MDPIMQSHGCYSDTYQYSCRLNTHLHGKGLQQDNVILITQLIEFKGFTPIILILASPTHLQRSGGFHASTEQSCFGFTRYVRSIRQGVLMLRLTSFLHLSAHDLWFDPKLSTCAERRMLVCMLFIYFLGWMGFILFLSQGNNRIQK